VSEVARYALFGDPVSRSLSPRIHAAFARQFGIAMRYEAITACADEFPALLARFGAEGGCGGNVTAPLKADAARLCRGLSAAAARAGVVNTLVARPDGGFDGDNTDGAGFVADLVRRHGFDLRDARVLALGAGGAVAGVLPALLDAGVREVVIGNRTAARAQALAEGCSGGGGHVAAATLPELAGLGVFDLVINGTSAAVHGQAFDLPVAVVGPRTLAYDLNYGDAAKPFVAWARAAGARSAYDGLGMLVEQAAIAFSRWHGVVPDTDPVYALLRGSD
jgi:shikimate dehydrogenase